MSAGWKKTAMNTLEHVQSSVVLRVLEGTIPDAPPAPRILNPGRTLEHSPYSPPLAIEALYASVADAHRERRAVVPEAERHRVRRTSTLLSFWREFVLPIRRQDIARRATAPGTLEKETQAMTRFSRWELGAKPDAWPQSVVWTGLPLEFLTGPYIERFLRDLLPQLARATVESTWTHLRTVLNMAVKMRAIDAAPKVDLTGIFSGRSADNVADFCASAYTDSQLSALYSAFEGDLELQVALVVGANVGPRAEDLFGFHWRMLTLEAAVPEVWYTAQKTGKRHWMPLAPCVVSHLRMLLDRNRCGAGPVFPSLTSPGSKQPGKSRPARRRNRKIKEAMAAAGIPVTGDFSKPAQVLRSTCNTRLNNHRPGSGLLALHGPDADVNSRHYWNVRPLLIDAVSTLPQPDAFIR